MGVSCEDFGVPLGVDMCGMYWGSSIWRGFVRTEFGEFIGCIVSKYHECVRVFWSVRVDVCCNSCQIIACMR